MRGFTLVEVLFALVVVGIALAAAAAVLDNGLMAHNAAGDVDTALLLARDKLASAGITAPLHSGTTQGAFAGRFAWRVAVSRYHDAALAQLPQTGMKLYRVAVRVAWRDGWRSRAVALSTLRLEPRP